MAFVNITVLKGAGSMNFVWDFGNNQTSSIENPQHLYSSAFVILAVYNVEGKLVQQLVNTRQLSGKHTYSFSGSDAGFGPGMYLVRLIIDGQVQMQRVIELR